MCSSIAKSIICAVVVLALSSLSEATTLYTTWTVGFVPQAAGDSMHFYTQVNNQGWVDWYFTEPGSRSITFSTQRASTWPGYELLRMYGWYYFGDTGFKQPLLAGPEQDYASSPPYLSIQMTNYWTNYKVVSNTEGLYLAWNYDAVAYTAMITWAETDPVPPPPPPAPSVPEPASVALVGLGLAAAWLLRLAISSRI